MTRDQKLMELACKETLMNIVKESEILDEKLNFFQKTMLFDKIREMKYEDVISLLAYDGKKITTEQKREFESKTKRRAKYGAAGAAGMLGGKVAIGGKELRVPFANVTLVKSKFDRTVGLVNKLKASLINKNGILKSALKKGKSSKEYIAALNDVQKTRQAIEKAENSVSVLKKTKFAKGKGGFKGAAAAVAGLYLYRKISDPCVRKNLGNKSGQLLCRAEAVKKVIDQIKSKDLTRCARAANPNKCKSKVGKELIKWQTKYQELMVQYNQSRRK